jgi:hypothetical protein
MTTHTQTETQTHTLQTVVQYDESDGGGFVWFCECGEVAPTPSGTKRGAEQAHEDHADAIPHTPIGFAERVESSPES